MTTQSQRLPNQGGGGNNYRKVFKPNFGDDEPSKPPRGGNGFNAGRKPASRPPVNSRLPKKSTPSYGGMRGDTDEDQIEYQPTKRSGNVRSSRISEPGSGFKQPSYSGMQEFSSNAPKTSKQPKMGMGVGRKPASKPASKPAYGRANIPSSTTEPSTSGLGASSYPTSFGDDAYEKPTDLRPCPSCGRSFNPEALAKHK